MTQQLDLPVHRDLTIIIVNWNSKDYLHKCLESVIANVAGVEYEIVVVDSGSFDGCGEMLAQHYPDVHFLQSEQNVGFARANNMGAKIAEGSVFLFLNPDTEVHGSAIQDLYGALATLSEAGIVGPRLLNSDGSLQASCVQAMPTILNQLVDIAILQRWFPRLRLWATAAMYEGCIDPVPIEALSGACIMTRREVFDRVGGFSADYFMYAEDLDLCWKVNGAAYRNYYIPASEIVHHGGGSTQHGRSHFSEVMVPESVSRLLRKTHGNVYSIAYRMALSAAALVRLLLIALTFPAGCLAQKNRSWSLVFRKWVSILRWGLGMEKWVTQYGRFESPISRRQ